MEREAPRPLKRLSAFLWDVTILYGAWQAFLLPSLVLLALAFGGEESEGIWPLLQVLWALSFVAYFALFTWRDGATPGKRLAGLRVEGAEGGRAGLAQLALREAVKLLSLGLLGLPFLALLLRRDRRGLHDLAAGTRVREG